MSAKLITVSYYSRCLIPEKDRRAELSRIVSHSTRNNAVRAITGLVTLQGDQFIQVLEGSAQEIDRTFRAIGKDPRHSDINVVSMHQGGTRRFAKFLFGHAGRTEQAQDYFSASIKSLDGFTHAELCRLLERLVEIDRKYMFSHSKSDLTRLAFI